MSRLSTSISIQQAKTIRARSHDTCGVLILEFSTGDWKQGVSSVAIYTYNDALAEKLAKAINDVVGKHKNKEAA